MNHIDMNRIDELTYRLLDHTLTASEQRELETLLANDPVARERHLATVRLEAELRGLYTELDLAEATIRRIEAERADRMAEAVLAQIAVTPAPAWSQPSTRRWWYRAAALAAMIIVVFWLGISRFSSPSPEPAPTDFARITNIVGAVEIVGPEGTVIAQPNQPLAPGQTLRTIGEDSVAIVEYPDRTRVELHPDSAIRLANNTSADATRKLFLLHGQLSAVVTNRPTHVGTGSADVVAKSGTFSLCASGLGSARIEMTEGEVSVRAGDDAQPMTLIAGQAVYVRDDQTPLSLEPRTRINTTPHEYLDFHGATHITFGADNLEVYVTSAKQWVRGRLDSKPVFPAERQLLLPKVWNDGPVGWLTTNATRVVTSRVEDKTDRLVVWNLPAGTEYCVFPVRVPEMRFMCVAPDGTWVATTRPKPNNLVQLWDTTTGRERWQITLERPVFCTMPTPDGKYIAVEQSDLGRGTNNKIAFYDTQTGTLAFALPTQRRQVTALAFSADGRLMAAGLNGAVQIWDVEQRQLIRTLEGFERVVSRVAFGGDLIAAGMQDGQVWLWSLETWEAVQVLYTGNRGVRALAFSPNGRWLASATNKAPVALWDLSNK